MARINVCLLRWLRKKHKRSYSGGVSGLISDTHSMIIPIIGRDSDRLWG
jgi:hypothetical protein